MAKVHFQPFNGDLTLSDYRLDDDGIRAIIGRLKDDTLQHLTLNMCGLSDSDIVRLMEGLMGNSTLHTLWLQANYIKGVGVAALATVLKNNKTALQTLELSCNTNLLYDYDHVESLKLLSEALMVNTTLHRLTLGYTGLEDSHAVTLCKGLKRNNVLRVLHLNGNSLTCVTAAALCDLLKPNCALQTLKLGENKFGDMSALAFANALTYNETLSTLSLRWNLINISGMKALAAALRVNCTLCTLSLGNNTASCLRLISNAMRTMLRDHNAALEDLDGIYFDDKDNYLQRNCDGKVRVRQSAFAAYQVCRLRLTVGRDMAQLLARYVYATKGQICWVVNE